MNNLYHKIAVASVGIALGFALGPNKEVKAATFTLTGTEFAVEDMRGPNGSGPDGLGDVVESDVYQLPVNRERNSDGELTRETRAFYEFNIGNLYAANTVISHAIFEAKILNFDPTYRYTTVNIYGYVGNGRPDVSDFQAGVLLTWDIISIPPSSYETHNNYFLKLYVTEFVQQRISNGDAFAGFGIRLDDRSWGGNYASFNLGGVYNPYSPTLTIDAAEPVPEPTTIFGSALALGVGGWLKRKKSSQHNKITLQS